MRGALAVLLAWTPSAALAVVPVVGGPCEGCDAIFDLAGPAPTGQGRIAPEGAPGQPMRVRGVVTDAKGHPRPGVVVYAYQTDASGLYQPDEAAPSRSGRRHGRYRGWVQTDQQGQYELQTVRPGGYPATDLPEHIHMHVLEPGCATYYLEDVTFQDDPRLTDAKRREFASGRGGSGSSVPRHTAGVWLVQRNIRLGLNIPGHPGCP